MAHSLSLSLLPLLEFVDANIENLAAPTAAATASVATPEPGAVAAARVAGRVVGHQKNPN